MIYRMIHLTASSLWMVKGPIKSQVTPPPSPSRWLPPTSGAKMVAHPVPLLCTCLHKLSRCGTGGSYFFCTSLPPNHLFTHTWQPRSRLQPLLEITGGLICCAIYKKPETAVQRSTPFSLVTTCIISHVAFECVLQLPG